MKRIHPNVSYTAVLALSLLIALGGCRGPMSGGVTNPFTAPDRVPPPATRALLPGQAQPYYPGDPLPVMHSATAPADNATAASRSTSPPPNADASLAWASPGSTTQPPNNPIEPRPIVANETAVRIPADGDSLRFEMPPPAAPQPVAPVSVAVPAKAPQPAQPAAMPPIVTVMAASYSQPVAGSPSAMNNVQQSMPVDQITTGPWRSPRIAQASSGSPAAVQPVSMQPVVSRIVLPPPPMSAPNQIGLAPTTNTVDVRLRAIPSPPQPGDPMPRIRMPGYTTPMQPNRVADGFRPRSSMR